MGFMKFPFKGANWGLLQFGKGQSYKKQPRKYRKIVKRREEPDWTAMTKNQAWAVARDLYDGPASKVIGFELVLNSKGELVPGQPKVVDYDAYPR